MIDFKALAAPFPPDAISWRVGSTTQDKSKGMALAYIDARDVMQRLDDVCGPAGWQCTYPHANGKTVCSIAIKCGDEWVCKSDGAGDTDVEQEKGALSDAFKRAAVRWGIGRYLYDIGSPWVELEQRGKTHIIKASEQGKLRAALTRGPGQKEPPPPDKPKSDRDAAFKYSNEVVLQVQSMKTERFLDDYLKAEHKSPPWADVAVNHPDLLAIIRKAVTDKRADFNPINAG